MSSVRRCPNYSEEERQFAMNLIEEFADILENKKLDAISLKQKSEAWSIIEKRYNSENSIKRSISQLKVLYKNMKMAFKKASANEDQNETKCEKFTSISAESTEEMNMTHIHAPPRLDSTHIPLNGSSSLISRKRLRKFKSEFTDSLMATKIRLMEESHRILLQEAKLKMQFLTEEHNLKMQFLTEEHELEMEKKQLEISHLELKINLMDDEK